jgi:pilus assembly protein Flp/PilA
MNTVFATLYARVIRPVRDRLKLSLEDGLEAVEYALIAALLSVVVIGAMQVFGGGIDNIYQGIADRLTTEGGNVVDAPDAPVE